MNTPDPEQRSEPESVDGGPTPAGKPVPPRTGDEIMDASLAGRGDQVRALRDRYITGMVEKGSWAPEVVPADVVGLSRDVTVLRGKRSGPVILHDHHGDKDTFCPPIWWDLGIGSGACGLGCRSCFLMLTFRTFRDPMMPVIYSNVADFWKASQRWLRDPDRKFYHTMGLGIDHADSLLYEGVTGHARKLIPIFADPEQNPRNNPLILLTKSTNVRYLEGLPTKNVAVTFSLNPERIADLWEGKWPDTGERITPSITDRLAACKRAQDMGFEVRFRVDPILTPEGWQRSYRDFFAQAAEMGILPSYITLGTYREKRKDLDLWREKWGLPGMEYEPANLEHDGTHFHLSKADRIAIYNWVKDEIQKHLPAARVSLCKETKAVRVATRLCNADCNCLL